jgi:hypothetical protein
MKPSEDPQKAALALFKLSTLMEGLGIQCWLTDGTLLGHIRENGFIPHDHDMDLAAHIDNYTPELDEHLIQNGFVIKRRLGSPEKGLENQLSKDGFNIDIFWHYTDDDGRIWHAAYDRKGMIKYYYDGIKLESTHFYGYPFWMPSPPKLHLVQKYGSDWRTPKVKWDWADEPKNARRE